METQIGQVRWILGKLWDMVDSRYPGQSEAVYKQIDRYEDMLWELSQKVEVK